MGYIFFLRKVNGDILSMKRTKIMIGGTSALTLMSLGVVDVYADETPKPTGNIIARGEDGVPWELYENGYLLFKPVQGKDTLVNNLGNSSWKINHGAKIKHLGFTGKVYLPENSKYLFSRYGEKDYNFNPITFDTDNLDTSKVINMEGLFSGLSNLTSLDVSRFDTSKVVNMQAMFSNMSKLTNLDVTHFDTRNVTDMSLMFYNVSKLANLDVTQFNTSNVTTMENMFNGMSKLTNLNVTRFNTSKVTSMAKMFADMSKLTDLNVSHFDTSKVTDMNGMFSGLSELTNLNVINFDTRNVTIMRNMFNGMFRLKSLDVTRFDTSKVTNMSFMFNDLHDLTDLDVTHFNTSKVTSMENMFSGSRKLTNLNVRGFNTSNVTSMRYMFDNLASLTNLDVSHFDTSKVTDMYSMFNGNINLKNLDVSNFNTSKVTNMGYMFSRMVRLINLDVSRFDTGNVKDMRSIFDETYRLKELKLGDKFKGDGIRTLREEHGYSDQYTEKWHKVNDKAHPYSVQDWANLYNTNPLTTAGTWVREEKPITDSILTFDGEKFPPVKFKPNSDAFPELPRPSKPKPNHKFVGWSRTPGGEPIDPKTIKSGEEINLHPIWKPVENTKNRTEKITITTVYEADPNLDYGKRTETAGVEGEKRVTTTYTVKDYTGELINPVESETITTPMKPKVVKVGTKPTSKVENIPSPKRYEKDNMRPRGEADVVTNGRPGTKTTTTTYTVDSKTGNVTPKTGQPVTVEATPTIVKVAAKDKEVVEKIPSPVVYEKDPNRDRGAKDERIEGKEGTITKIITYNVNTDTGVVTETASSPVRKEPTNTIIKVGARDKVVTTPIEPVKEYVMDKTRDRGTPDVIEKGKVGSSKVTTTYSVNPKTGDVTENTLPPVVDPAGKTIVKVGGRDKVVTTPIEPVKEYVIDKTRDRGTPDVIEKGKVGSSKVTTTYSVNPKTGDVTENTLPPVVDPAGKTIVKVGGRDKVVTEVIEPEVVYEKDDKGAGETIPGKKGSKVTTTTYTVNPKTGEVTEKVTGPVITPAGKTIIKIGAKDTVNEEVIKPKVRYEGDNTREKGTPDVTIPGKNGSKITIIAHNVDPKTGKVTDVPREPVITNPTDTVIKVGTKPKVVVTEIPAKVKYVPDYTRKKGEADITVPGKKGSVTTTTTYEVNPETGKIIETVGKPVTEAPGETIIKVAAKGDTITETIEPIVEYVPDETGVGGETKGTSGKKVIPITYEVDPNTGKITEKRGEPVITPPGKTIVKVGTKPKVETEVIKSRVIYETDKSRDRGTPDITIPGKDGSKVTTTTFNVDKVTGKVTTVVGKPVITEPTDTIVKVGAKDKVVVEILEPIVEYVRDDLGAGEVIKGKPGKKTTTTIYTVDRETGKVTEHVVGPEVELPGKTIIKIGTKDKVVTVDIEPKVRYVADKEREKGSENITVPGKKGRKTTVTKFELDPKTGKVTEVVGKPVIENPTDTIVKVGAKDKVVVEEIKAKVIYSGDETRDYGSDNVVEAGKVGGKVTTTVYSVDPDNGKVSEKVGVKVEEPGITRVKVGTKPIVKTVTGEDGNIYEETTTFNVDPDTGKVTQHVTRKLIKDVNKEEADRIRRGNIPPVLEVPEYKGTIAGNGLDGEGGQITPPVLEVPEYTGVLAGNGLDGEGGQITPPVLDVPEYTGVLSGNGLDGEGGQITPPVLDVPEYTGPIAGNGLDGEGGQITPPVLDVPEYKGEIKKEEPKEESKKELSKKEPIKLADVPSVKTSKTLPETGNDNYTIYGLAAVLLGFLARFNKRKNEK